CCFCCCQLLSPTLLLTLSLHDALPIFCDIRIQLRTEQFFQRLVKTHRIPDLLSRAFLVCRLFCFLTYRLILRDLRCRFCAFSLRDRKSTRLNSSHVSISYAVFCLKKKT